jgi:hypothetical protein
LGGGGGLVKGKEKKQENQLKINKEIKEKNTEILLNQQQIFTCMIQMFIANWYVVYSIIVQNFIISVVSFQKKFLELERISKLQHIDYKQF